MNWRGSVSTEITSCVFCAVRATIAEVPCTPQRANAFRSAWIPAPPPESEVAMVIAIGTHRSAVTWLRLVTGTTQAGRGQRGALVAAGRVRPEVAAQLKLHQGRGQRARMQTRPLRKRVGAGRALLHEVEDLGELRLERRTAP